MFTGVPQNQFSAGVTKIERNRYIFWNIFQHIFKDKMAAYEKLI